MRAALAILAMLLLASCGAAEPAWGPTVVATQPAQGATVSAGETRIVVTFSAPMQPMGWSLVRESAQTFPRVTGQPRQSEDLTRFTVPVALEPGRTYVVRFNSEGSRNFRDREGRPAWPHRLEFTTAPR